MGDSVLVARRRYRVACFSNNVALGPVGGSRPLRYAGALHANRYWLHGLLDRRGKPQDRLRMGALTCQPMARVALSGHDILSSLAARDVVKGLDPKLHSRGGHLHLAANTSAHCYGSHLTPTLFHHAISRTRNERNLVQRLKLASLVAGLLLGLAPGGATLAQQTPTPVPLAMPPGPVTHFPTRFDVVDAPAQFDQVLMIIDFPSGAWTPPHAPGGSLYMTVIEGELSTRNVGPPGQTDTYPAGSTFTADPGEYLELGNLGADNTRVIATVLLPKGVPLISDRSGSISDASGPTDDSGAPALRPTTVYQTSIDIERPAGAFELVHLLLDLDPGVRTPQHIHGGMELVIVTAGEVTLQRHGDTEVFAPGESWVNTSGVVHAAGNDGTDFAQVAVTFLLPAGRPLTTVV